MGRRVCALVVLASFACATSGCVTHHQLSRPLTAADVTAVQKQIESRGGSVEFEGPGGQKQVSQVKVGAVRRLDGPQPSLVFATEGRTISLEQVQAVQVINRGEGAKGGLLLGLLSGIAVGVLAAWSEKKPTCGSSDGLCMDFRGAIVVPTAMVGSLLGLAIGASYGQTHEYRY